MRTCKIIDTCTLINLFCEDGPDVSSPLSDYEVLITDTIVDEYTRKYPREVPKCVSVIDLIDEDRQVMNDLESLMPRIGPGERSAYALMIRLSKDYDRIVMLTDDQRATKKLREYMRDDKLFTTDAQIIWGNTNDLISKFTLDGKIISRFRRSPILSGLP